MTDIVWKKSYFLKSNFAELLYSIQKSLSTYPGEGEGRPHDHKIPQKDTMIGMVQTRRASQLWGAEGSLEGYLDPISVH